MYALVANQWSRKERAQKQGGRGSGDWYVVQIEVALRNDPFKRDTTQGASS